MIKKADMNPASLEIITPIRGRKRIGIATGGIVGPMFRNNNPDKGTETMKNITYLRKKIV